MLYINKPNAKPVLYSDLVKAAIKSGVQPQRAYLYLASLGIKGMLTRQLLADGNGYGKPKKLAVNEDEHFINSFSICDSCGTLKIF